MRLRRRTWESGHTTHYRQWNHMRARSMDKKQRTTNHNALPILQVSSLISNDVFNIDAPDNGAIRLGEDNQGKHGTGRQLVIRVDSGWQPALLGGGRQINDKRTEMRKEEERYMHARENCSGGQGAWGEYRRGECGGTRAISGRGNVTHNPNNKGTESSDTIDAVLGLESQ